MHPIVPISILLTTLAGCEAAEASPATPAYEAPEGATVTAKIAGLRSTEGGVLAYLHGSEETFPRHFDQAAKTNRKRTLDATSATLRFTDVPPGTYALVVVHDENGNGTLDKNLVGFPKEGVGASNVKKGRPSWKSAKFEVTEDRTVRVSIQYF